MTTKGMQGGRVRKPQPAGKGYLSVTLSMRGVIKAQYVHQMVLAAFIRPVPEGMEVLHGDDNRTNNWLSNLRYDTHKRNQEEASERGRSAFGERNGMAVVTEEIVAEIRSAAAAGVQRIAIAEYHGISRAQTCRIVLRRNWSRVPPTRHLWRRLRLFDGFRLGIRSRLWRMVAFPQHLAAEADTDPRRHVQRSLTAPPPPRRG